MIEESSEMTSASTGSVSRRIPVHGENDSRSIPPKQKQSVIPSRNDCSCTVGSLIGSQSSRAPGGEPLAGRT